MTIRVRFFATAFIALVLISVGGAKSARAATNIADTIQSNECDLQFPVGTAKGCFTTTAANTTTITHNNTGYFASATATPSPYIGARSDSGDATGALDVWGVCRYVDNISTDSASLFVPFNTAAEWNAFVKSYPPASISLKDCAVPYSVTGSASQASVLLPTTYTDIRCTPRAGSQVIATPDIYGRPTKTNASPQTICQAAAFDASGNAPVIRCPATPSTLIFDCGNTIITSTQSWLAGDVGTTDVSKGTALSWTQQAKFSPDLTLTASAASVPAAPSITVDSGTPVTLTWNAPTATSCTASTSASPTTETTGVWSGQVPSASVSGGYTLVTPTVAATTTYTYTLSCSDSNNLTSTAYVTVSVESAVLCGITTPQKSLTASTAGLCTNNGTSSGFAVKSDSVSGSPEGWTWSCVDSTSNTISCGVPETSSCGTKNGSSVSYGNPPASSPMSNLCGAGTNVGAPVLNSSTPPTAYVWSCQTSVNGSTATSPSCSASLSAATCANIPSADSLDTTTTLCMGGTLVSSSFNAMSDANGTEGWTWGCQDGHSVETYCAAPATAACTTGDLPVVDSTGHFTATSPAPCLNGEAVDLTSSGGVYTYKCSTSVSTGGNPPISYENTSPACSATVATNGVCNALVEAQTFSPSSPPPGLTGTNLCSSGSLDMLNGGVTVANTGGWTWTCDGSGGGKNAPCHASGKCPTSGGSGCDHNASNGDGYWDGGTMHYCKNGMLSTSPAFSSDELTVASAWGCGGCHIEDSSGQALTQNGQLICNYNTYSCTVGGASYTCYGGIISP